MTACPPCPVCTAPVMEVYLGAHPTGRTPKREPDYRTCSQCQWHSVCGAEKPVKGGALTFRCDLPTGHAGKHEDNSMRPVLHAAWDEGAA